MSIYNGISLAGLCVLIALAWACSAQHRVFNARVVVWGTLLQLAFGAAIFLAPAGVRLFMLLNEMVNHVMNAAMAGARFCFGVLATPPGQAGSLGFILITQGFPTIVFFASLMEILYFLKVMPFCIRLFARLFTRLMRVSGAESLCTASNIFVGIESTTTILPYLSGMTRSEICTVLTAGLATIASSVLGLYVLLLRDQFPQIAGHLISASLLSAPAALVMSKLVLPETGRPVTWGRDVALHCEPRSNVIEAAIAGATEGGKLMLGVVVMLLAFVGLVELLDLGLDGVASLVQRGTGVACNLRLEHLLAYVFYPLVLVIGVPPVDAWEVARLLGMRIILTEVPAYQQLSALLAAHALHYERSAVLAAYALCGFSHLPSVAIFVGGIAALAPGQTRTLAQVALRALLAATLACLMTAAVAGVFCGGSTVLFSAPVSPP